MPNINLPTGKTIYVSTYQYYFLLNEDDLDEFFQSSIADDLGTYIDNPFSNKTVRGSVDFEDTLPLDDISDEISDDI